MLSELLLSVALSEDPPVAPVELSEAPPLGMPLPVSPPVEPPDELVPAPDVPEVGESDGLLPDMSPLLEAPPLLVPLSGMSLLEVPPVAVPLLEVPGSEAPPLVPAPGAVAPPEASPGGMELAPPDGGVLGAAAGGSDGGGVDDEGADVSGGLLVVPVVPGSPPLSPRLQAATLIVSKPIRIKSFEACSLEFIAIPFNSR